jgi:TonB family protein
MSNIATTKSSPAAAAARAGAEPRLLPVVTLVIWLACLVVGGLGFAYPYARPRPKPPEPVVVAQRIQVELTSEPLPPEETPPAPPDPRAPPPPLPDNPVVAAAPPLLAVAEPSPAIAFALPVEGPVRVVPVEQAAFARPAEKPAVVAPAPAPAPQALTFGQGEGRQPAPEYPFLARRRGQEGTVVIRFTVGTDGRVLAAEAVQPSPWPLLNEAALAAVRERWRFPTGAVRLYEVPIQFVLKK